MPSAFQSAVAATIAERNTPEYQIKEHAAEIKDALKSLDLPTVAEIAKKTIPACKGLKPKQIADMIPKLLGLERAAEEPTTPPES